MCSGESLALVDACALKAWTDCAYPKKAGKIAHKPQAGGLGHIALTNRRGGKDCAYPQKVAHKKHRPDKTTRNTTPRNRSGNPRHLVAIGALMPFIL
jgi:hypothetical protein